MKINKINYKVYGKLIDQELLLSRGVNILVGDNEAGKSTIFNSISTLIYGFKPTNRDKHPYTNWEKNEINFVSEIEDTGNQFIVERSLKSAPKLNIVVSKDNRTQIYRNETLPFINHISDALFEAVFHLTAEDLNQLEKESIESIQEKLIFNYGTEYLNKASDVIVKLEGEINSLWRKDKRGNPQINQLQAEINALKLKRNEAEKFYDLIKVNTSRLEEINSGIEKAAIDKRYSDVMLKNYRGLMPAKDLISRISNWRRSIYKSDAFKELEPRLLDTIEQNQNRYKELKEKIGNYENEKIILMNDLFIYSKHDENLINFKPKAENLKNTLTELMRLEHDEHTRLEELIKVREKINTQYKIIFEDTLDESKKNALKKILVLDLMTLFQKFIEGSNNNEELSKREFAINKNNKRTHLIIMLTGVLVSLLGFVYEPLKLLIVIGMLLIGYSAAKLKPTHITNTFEKVDLEAIKANISLHALGLALPEYVYTDSNLRFFGKLEQLIMLLHEEDQLHDKWMALCEQQQNMEQIIEDAMKASDFDSSRGVKLSLQYILAQIDRLTEIQAVEAKKNAKIDNLLSNIEGVREELIEYKSAYSLLMDQVKDFGDGDYEFGYSKIEENIELSRKIKVLTDELNLLTYDAEEVEEISKERIEDYENKSVDLSALEKKLIAEKYTVTTEISRINEMINIEEINSQILIHEETLGELIERRNKLMILMEIIKFSDDRFRVENQPNIITRVSYFMNQMTRGKYSEVLISENNGQFELQFLLRGEIVPVSRAFSKGTMQQLFFAYRLAVLEALDPMNQLPFVLDEAFVNWDAKRFNETIKLLVEISKERQILIFTCHRSIAEKISEITRTKPIEVSA